MTMVELVDRYRARILLKTFVLRHFGKDDEAWTAVRIPGGYLDLNVWRDEDGVCRMTAYRVVADGVDLRTDYSDFAQVPL